MYLNVENIDNEIGGVVDRKVFFAVMKLVGGLEHLMNCGISKSLTLNSNSHD